MRSDIATRALYSVQADGLEIEAAAKRRLADEYDAAQERGEVATDGRPKTLPDQKGFSPPTTKQVGLTYKEVHDARQFRDAERATSWRSNRASARELSELQQSLSNYTHCCTFENSRFVRVCA